MARSATEAWRVFQYIAALVFFGLSIVTCSDLPQHDVKGYQGMTIKRREFGYGELQTANKMFHIKTGLDLMSRKILQTVARQSLCGWDGECFARRYDLMPDTEIRDYLIQTHVCGRLTTKEGCDATDACLWDVSNKDCGKDFSLLLQDCMVNEWTIWRRQFECGGLGTKEKCEIINGCKWNGGICEINFDDGALALQANSALKEGNEIDLGCGLSTEMTCSAPCKFASSGVCLFPGIRYRANWFNKNDSALCRFAKQDMTCLDKNPPNCSRSCELQKGDASDYCFPPEEARIGIAYELDPELGDLMLEAIVACPTFTDELSCKSFVG